MVSLSRRQMLIGGLVIPFVPAVSFAVEERLVLSGRVLGRDGKPLGGASFAIGKDRIATDADGRFMLVTDTRAYPASHAGRDDEGTWRATVGLKL